MAYYRATWRRIGNDWVVVMCGEDAHLADVGMVVSVVSKGGRETLVRLTERFRSGPGYLRGTYRGVPLGAKESPRAANAPPRPNRT